MNAHESGAHAFGGPELLKLDDVPVPQPRDDEIIVKVQAVSVNPIARKMRSGKVGLRQKTLPIVLGRDVFGNC